VNQWLNPLYQEAGSNLVDMGRSAVRVFPEVGMTTRMSVVGADYEATVKACGVAVARPQGKSWTSIRSNGARGTWEPSASCPNERPARSLAGRSTVD
jgi:hypothetical protein